MLSDKELLRIILDSTEYVAEFINGYDEEMFLSDKLVQSAVLQKLTSIGEATERLSSEIKNTFIEVSWEHLSKLCSIALNVQSEINWRKIWIISIVDIPDYRATVLEIMKKKGY